MLEPSFSLFVSALVAFVICLYYLLINKESRRKWASPMKFLFYFGLAISSLVVIWGLAYIVVTQVLG